MCFHVCIAALALLLGNCALLRIVVVGGRVSRGNFDRRPDLFPRQMAKGNLNQHLVSLDLGPISPAIFIFEWTFNSCSQCRS